MATAKEFRDALIWCAKAAAQEQPDDINARTMYFAARLAGWMSGYSEGAVEDAIHQVLRLPHQAQQSAPGA